MKPTLWEKWDWYKWYYFQEKNPKKIFYYKEPFVRKVYNISEKKYEWIRKEEIES
jgi:hypothetical protein